MSDPIKDAPTGVLCDAARRVQEAHDYVEAHQFSFSYGADKDATHCCFIGSVRQVAGEHTVNPNGPSRDAASDVALLALDEATRALGFTGPVYRWTPGGVAEASIARDKAGADRGRLMRKPEALGTYRQALRMMHTELMAREDAPVGTSSHV